MAQEPSSNSLAVTSEKPDNTSSTTAAPNDQPQEPTAPKPALSRSAFSGTRTGSRTRTTSSKPAQQCAEHKPRQLWNIDRNSLRARLDWHR
ncbi:Uu.00g072760.m01.CDS01 [Anthostomella pinea]|uniref:Uu.00g072760.m01.CDS01 n=1 Tax=Anthostomella pinea TaxID=933095 RepID=A0AAI8VPI2_9PEZI|nr:Uu.00g072760.m01.CDS01 [Anthostomella pinea]